MTITSLESPRDHILWILAGSGGRMERSKLRRASGLKIALLDPILDELMKEGRISITGKDKNIIALMGQRRWMLYSYVTYHNLSARQEAGNLCL